MKLQKITWLSYERHVYKEHPPHLHHVGWLADYPDPDNFLRVAFRAQRSAWHDAQYEQLLDSARRVNDLGERLKFYQAADRLLVQEAGIMPFSHDQLYLLIKPWVKRYPVSAIGIHYWKDVIIEAH